MHMYTARFLVQFVPVKPPSFPSSYYLSLLHSLNYYSILLLSLDNSKTLYFINLFSTFPLYGTTSFWHPSLILTSSLNYFLLIDFCSSALLHSYHYTSLTLPTHIFLQHLPNHHPPNILSYPFIVLLCIVSHHLFLPPLFTIHYICPYSHHPASLPYFHTVKSTS